MTPLRLALAVLACALAAAAPAGAAQPPLGEGAWSWFGDPRAVSAGDKTFTGWVDHEGDIKVASFDHASEERITAVLQARLNQDDHANPSIHVQPDGRLMIFYSRHVGPAMHYRISTNPGDVRSWGAPRTVPVNVPGPRGYTYPNPIRLDDEQRTYLFWRGGNYNPTFSTQGDGSDTWSPARNLIVMPNERPYVKYAASGGDTIHVAYTNAHPAEFPAVDVSDVNIYYARVRGGRIETAGGADLGPLGEPIHPSEGDAVYNPPVPTWVHDVAADPEGDPVIVFARFAGRHDHRYHYARWTGSSWEVHEITAAGASFRGDGGSPYYSGGLTLDHENPARVYLSRRDPGGLWRVEAWTTPDGGDTWSSQAISAPEAQPNVRPVSPRGMPDPFTQDLRVLWMRGPYPNYEQYGTSIMALTGDANLPPVADAEPSVRSGPSPLEVRFDGTHSSDPEGGALQYQWNFGDGATGTGATPTHTYTQSGRYFPALTVTDGGASSTLVEEIAVDLPSPPVTHTGATEGSTAHGAIDPENRATQWYFEYGPTGEYGARTPMRSLPASDSLHQVSAALPGLVEGRLYHYRLVGSSSAGTTEGEDRVMVAGAAQGSDAYRDVVLATQGLAGYWRLGEPSGSGAQAERGPAGAFAGRFVLGQVGVLGPLGDTAPSFDGSNGEATLPGPALGGSGSMEGWFRWRAGTAVMRDNTGPNQGWLLAFNNGGTLRYRVGGQGYNTGIPIEDVRDGTWHHLVATKSGDAARLYLDGGEIHSATGEENDTSALPWRVMRNGSNNAFSDGEADEIALYTRALTPTEVRSHYDVARELAGRPLPPETPDSAVDPPAAGTGLGGGVLGAGVALPGGGSGPSGRSSVRAGVLMVRGAPGVANRLTARRRGRAWVIADAAAPLRAGVGCRQAGPNAVRCRAFRVKRIELHGGAGADRLAVTGRMRALLDGGPGDDRLVAGTARALLSGGAGRDVLTGGPLARFRGGPGSDRVVRRR